MSWASLVTARDGRWSDLGYNLRRGLLRWRAGLGQAAKTGAGTGLGGVDVVLLGDSLGFGFSSARPFEDGWFHRLKLMLQGEFNPSGVPGGYGFLRLGSAADRRAPHLSLAGSVSDGSANDGSGGAWISMPVASGKANRVSVAFDGGNPDSALRRAVTAAHVVYTKAPNANSDARIDVGTAAPGTGNGNVVANQLLDTSAASQTNGHRVLLSGLDRAVTNHIQVASGPTSGGLGLYVEGLIAYDGDYDAGVRCHNLAYPSAISSWVAGTANKLNTNVVRWCAGPGAGASNAKLYIVALGANDMGTGASATVGVATYRQQIAALCDSITSQPSKPSVLLLAFPVRADGTGAHFGRSVDHPREYLRALTDIAATRPDVCVLDLNRWFGGSLFWSSAGDNSYLSLLSPHGWNAGDLVHLSEGAQGALAGLMFDLLGP